jgi:hypothetical protein
VDVGRDFLITGESKLYFNSPGPTQFAEFTPTGFALAARSGILGFTVLKNDEAASWRRDRIDQERRKLERRGRMARDPWER